MTTPAILYHGRPMSPEPINATLDGLASQIARGHTVVAQLEPGDATHYCLVITPTWAPHVAEHLGRFGIPADGGEYLLVTYLRDGASHTFFVKPSPLSYDFDEIENLWTRELLAWWFDALWRAIQEAQP